MSDKPVPIVVKVDVSVGERDTWGGATHRVKFAFEETVPSGQGVMAYLRNRIREELKRQESTFVALYPAPAEDEL